MVEAFEIKREPEKPKEVNPAPMRNGVKRSNKGFIFLVIILLLLASSAWGLALNSQWRQALYPSFKEASLKETFLPAVEERREEVYQPPKELTITYFDVGQGLGHLIRIPSGKVIMYDAGEGTDPDYKYSKYRGAGEKATLPVLRGEHIKKIDVIVGSHPHSDHLGGFIPILSSDEFEIGEVLDPGMVHPTPTYNAILELIEKKGIPYRIVRDGEILDWGPEVFVQVLSPPKGRLWNHANDNSVTIKLIYGKTSFLFTGDIEKAAINNLINEYGSRIKADVVQVPHHGSNSSNDRNFIRLVGVSHAVTSGTGGPPFGHPTSETVKRWRESGAQVHQTHLSGDITIISDGKNIRVKTMR
ncbi:MBL fold metallo-hydrolase [bacterium]|nr:MBL fold metallo-hydrolase [bacterium]